MDADGRQVFSIYRWTQAHRHTDVGLRLTIQENPPAIADKTHSAIHSQIKPFKPINPECHFKCSGLASYPIFIYFDYKSEAIPIFWLRVLLVFGHVLKKSIEKKMFPQNLIIFNHKIISNKLVLIGVYDVG